MRGPVVVLDFFPARTELVGDLALLLEGENGDLGTSGFDSVIRAGLICGKVYEDNDVNPGTGWTFATGSV